MYHRGCSAHFQAFLEGDIRCKGLFKPRIQGSITQHIETVYVPTQAAVFQFSFIKRNDDPRRSGNFGLTQSHADCGNMVVAVGVHELTVDVGCHAIAPRHIPAVARVARGDHKTSLNRNHLLEDASRRKVTADAAVGMEEHIVVVDTVVAGKVVVVHRRGIPTGHNIGVGMTHMVHILSSIAENTLKVATAPIEMG